MKKFTKEEIISNVKCGIGIAFLLGLMVWGFLYATSAECWYAGMHDKDCEKLHGQETCECYERFLQHDKEMCEKIKAEKAAKNK